MCVQDASASGAATRNACDRRLRWRPPDQAGPPATTAPDGGGDEGPCAEVTRRWPGAGLVQQEASSTGLGNCEEMGRRPVQEEEEAAADSSCHHQHQDDVGFRQFKRRLTDSFCAFMRSDQPWLMYRRACKLPAVLDGALSDAPASAGGMLDFVSWIPQLREVDRSWAGTGAGRDRRAEGQDTVLNVVGRAGSRVSEFLPEFAASEQSGTGDSTVRDNVGGGVCADAENVEDASGLGPDASSGSRLEPAGSYGQSLFLGGFGPCQDECMDLGIKKPLPPCKSLRYMHCLDQKLHTEICWKLIVRRLANWVAELSVVTGFSSGGVLVGASQFSLRAGLIMSSPSPLDGEESSQDLKRRSHATEEVACVLMVKDGADLPSAGRFLRPDANSGGDDFHEEDAGGKSDTNSDVDTSPPQEQDYVTGPVDSSQSATTVMDAHVQPFPSKLAQGWQTVAASSLHSSRRLEKQKVLSSDGWLTKLVGPFMGNVGTPRYCAAFPRSDVRTHRTSEGPIGTLLSTFPNICDGWKHFVMPGQHVVEACEECVDNCLHQDESAQTGLQQEMNLPVIGGGRSCQTSLKRKRDSLDAEAAVSDADTTSSGACELVDVEVTCATQLPEAWGPCVGEENEGSGMHTACKSFKPPLEFGLKCELNTSSQRCEDQDSAVVLGQAPLTNGCVETIKSEESNTFTDETQVQNGRFVLVGGVGVKADFTISDEGSAQAISSQDVRCGESAHSAHDELNLSSDMCSIQTSIQLNLIKGMPGTVGQEFNGKLRSICDDRSLSSSAYGEVTEQRNSKLEVHLRGVERSSMQDRTSSDKRARRDSNLDVDLDGSYGAPNSVRGVERAPNTRSHMQDRTSNVKRARRDRNLDVDLDGSSRAPNSVRCVERAPNTRSQMQERISSDKRARRDSNPDVEMDGSCRAPNSTSQNVESTSGENKARRNSKLDADLDGVERNSNARSYILTSTGSEKRVGKKNKLDEGLAGSERTPNSRSSILNSESSEKKARKKASPRCTYPKGHNQAGVKVGNDKQTCSSSMSVKAQRNLESPALKSAGRDAVAIVLSDSSDDEIRERSKSSQADSQRFSQIRQAKIVRDSKGQTLEGKKVSSRLDNAVEDKGQVKYEWQSWTGRYDKKSRGKPWYQTHHAHEHKQTVHHERTQQSLGLTVSTRKDFGVRPPPPLQQSNEYLVSNSSVEEGKWSAWVTCDLCGNGPSLAYGEWYAWCCGMIKSRCLCLPESRLKWPQKSNKPLPRVLGGYVHRMCAIWSAEVVEQDHYMQDLSVAVRRGLLLKCAHCQKFGATLGCRVGRCRKSFHYPCADLLASRLQLRMWEGCSVAVACKDHQHIDIVCEAPVKLATELRILTYAGNYIGKKLICLDLSEGQEVVPIPCTNDVDNEPLPRIKYIIKCRYLKTGGVMRQGMCPGLAAEADGCNGCSRYAIDDPFAPISVHVPLLSSERCDDQRFDWQHQPMYGRLSYDDYGRLQLGWESTDVVECNLRCKCCPSMCKNRVLQNGLTVRLELFKTTNRGWGVRTIDDLARGTFVVEYVGELLTHDEAEERGRTYDANNHSCLFNLDHPDVPPDEILVLDGHRMSNVARFVNHSCDGNLMTCRVYTESIEKKFCRIGMYANRDIRAGTELCYDYNYSIKDVPQNMDDVRRVLRHPNTIRCRCGASNCRKVLWRGGP